jgi:hypothetical protein
MKMQVIVAGAVVVLASGSGWTAANAAYPPQSATVSPQAAQAAHAATQAARQVTFSIQHTPGTVRLYTIGRTRTRVVIAIPRGGNYRFRMYPGSECSTSRARAASALALTPMNTAVSNGPASETIVELPIEQVSKNYVVDVRNATDKAGVIAACTHLSP